MPLIEARDVRAAALLALCVFASTITPTAAAQESGGSFGGSHFGGGGSSSGSRDRGSSSGSRDRGSSFGRERRSSSFDSSRHGSSSGGSDSYGSSASPVTLPTAAELAAAERRRAQLAAERAAAELARFLAMPPLERAHAASWPTGEAAWPAGVGATDWAAPVPIRHTWAQTERVPDPTASVRERPRGPPSKVVFFVTSAFCFVPVLVLVLVLSGLFGQDKRSSSHPLAKNVGASEVRRVSLALDWTARRAIQAQLDALAARSTMRSKRGLFDALLATRTLLGLYEEAVRYAGWERVVTRGAKAAETAFQDRALALRARFRSELIRNSARAELGERTPRSDEGEGLVVVTILVATAHALPALPNFKSRNAAGAALRSIAPRNADSLWALEVIWSPAAEQDRLSSAELEVLYPELARTDGSSDVGRTTCDYCEATYPAELRRCPACGAPLSS